MGVTAIGWRAYAALVASGGRAEVFAPLSASAYATAAGEMIWIGPAGTPLHPRSVAMSEPPAVTRTPVRVNVDGITPWRPAPLHAFPDVTAAARILRESLTSVGDARGLARLFGSSANDDLVLARARPHASALARACATDDADAFTEAARPLLGLGAGLTPSGDDYVGGALFARRLIAPRDARAWDEAAARIVADAATLTHAISARLLEDLARGDGWASLHDLARGLADGDATQVLSAARALTGLGHTSGWDMLAGFASAVSGEPAIVP